MSSDRARTAKGVLELGDLRYWVFVVEIDSHHHRLQWHDRSSLMCWRVADAFVVVAAEGEEPCARHGHTAVVEESGGGLVVLFGGCNDLGVFCSDLHYFSIGMCIGASGCIDWVCGLG
jgi:hypothetical protein